MIDNLVMGTFTHRSTYLPKLQESIERHLPDVPYLHLVRKGPINANMEALRQAFIASGKRYWLFLDDDIQFLHPDTVRDALGALVRNRWAGVTVYSTFRPEALDEPYDPSALAEREVNWMVGYFVLVDSYKVGHIQPDLDLPDPNTSVDTSYSVAIKAQGYRLGIVPHYVYHQYKAVVARPEVIEPTNRYLLRKWGRFYFDMTTYQWVVMEWQ